MGSKLESLIVDLQLNSAQMRAGIDQANAKLKSFGDSIKAMGALAEVQLAQKVVGAVVDVGKAFVGLVMNGAEAVDHLGKVAAAAQISGEAFSKLNFQAGLSGVSTDELGQAFNKLNKNISQAASGSRDQVALFKALGVSVRDSSGHLRASDAIFSDLAARFNQLGPSASKAAVEMDLFGKSGARLEAMFQSNAAELNELATRLGLVFTDQQIAQTSDFKDKMETLQAAVEGVGQRVAIQLAPAFSKLADELLKSKGFAAALEAAVTALAFAVRLLVSGLLIAIEALIAFATAAKGVFVAMTLALTGNFSAAAAVLGDTFGTIGAQVVDLGHQLETVWSKVGESSDKAAKKGKDNADKIANAAKNAALAAADRDRDFELGRKVAGIDRGAIKEARGFGDAQARPDDVFARLTTGFKSFEEALIEATNQTVKRETWLSEAARRRAHGDIEGAEEALAFADKVSISGDRAKDAMDAFARKAKEDAEKVAQEMQKTFAAMSSLANQMLSKMGEFGSVVQAGIQGFQQGGWWGALIAVVIELLSHFKRFNEVVELANNIIFNLLDALGPGLNALVSGLDSLLKGVNSLFQVIGSLLNPVLRGVAIMFDHIGKTLSGVLDGGLGDAISGIGDFLDALMGLASVLDPMQPIIKLIGALLSLVGIGLLYVVDGLETAVGWLLGKLRELLGTLGLNDAALAVSKIEGAMLGAAKQAEAKAQAMWTKLGGTFDNFFDFGAADKDTPIDTGVTDPAKDGIKGLGDAAKDTAKSISKLGESFTNLPEGFKVRLASNQALDPTGTRSAGSKDTYHFHFAGSLLTEATLMALIQRMHDKASFRHHGFPKSG